MSKFAGGLDTGTAKGLSGGMGLLSTVLDFMGSNLDFMGSNQQAEGYRQVGIDKAESYEDLAAQYEDRSGYHIPSAQRKAGEMRRVSDIAMSDAKASFKGGAGDPSSVKWLAKAQTQGAYGAALQMFAGKQLERDDKIRAHYSRAAGERARIAGEMKAGAAKTSAFAGLLKGMGKAVTLAEKYNNTIPDASGPYGAYGGDEAYDFLEY